MAIVELQFREEAFGELLKRQVDGRRLSSPTAPVGPAPPGQPPTESLWTTSPATIAKWWRVTWARSPLASAVGRIITSSVRGTAWVAT